MALKNLKKKTKQRTEKSKLLTNLMKSDLATSPYIKNKKELAQLKAAYKAGTLKFDSKEIAESILENFRRGFRK